MSDHSAKRDCGYIEHTELSLIGFEFKHFMRKLAIFKDFPGS